MSSEYTPFSNSQNDDSISDIVNQSCIEKEDASNKDYKANGDNLLSKENLTRLHKPDEERSKSTIVGEFRHRSIPNERVLNEPIRGHSRCAHQINRGFDIMLLATIAEIEYERIATSQQYIPNNGVPIVRKRGRKRKYLGVPINGFDDTSSDFAAIQSKNLFGKFKLSKQPIDQTVQSHEEGRSSDIDGVHLAGDTIIDKDRIHKYGDIPDTTFFTGWQDNVFVFICPYPRCNKSFPSISRAKRHFIIHTEAKPYKCPNHGCNKWFSRKDNMNQHCRVHCKFAPKQDE